MPSGVHSKAHRALAETIRTLRERAKLTQDEFGKACGHDKTWVSRIETGAGSFNPHELPRMAKALQTTLPKFVKLWMALLDA